MKISADAGFDSSHAAMLWESFDTTSAPHIKSLVNITGDHYGVRWESFKESLRENELRSRRIRSDIVHAKRDYTCRELYSAVKTANALIRRKRTALLKPILAGSPPDKKTLENSIMEIFE